MAGAQTVAPARPASRQPDESSRRSRVQAARTNPPAAPLADWAQRQSQAAGPRVPLVPAQPAGAVELKGNGSFTPPPAVADHLAAQRRAAPVDVRFGSLAAGTIQVRRRKDRYDTAEDTQAIPLVHPALDPLVQTIGVLPVLALHVRNNVVTGYVTVGQGKRGLPAGRSTVLETIRKQPQALGWLGVGDLALPNQVNKLEAGTLTLQTGLHFTLGGFLKGDGRFGLVDETITFDATAKAQVAGLTPVTLAVKRGPDGMLMGSVQVAVAYGKFTGNLVASLAGGVVDVLGTARYSTDKLSGEVTLQVTDAATARDVAKRLLPPSAIRAEAAQAAGTTPGAKTPVPAGPRKGERATVGWGTLDAHFSEWLTGAATVIIDGDGFVTVIGRVAPPAVVPLFKKTARPRFFDIRPSFGFGVPYVARGYIGAVIWLGAIATIDAKLSQIEILGVYSTNPTIFNEFSIAGTLSVDALAGLEGGVGVEGGIELLGHDVTVGAGIDLTAGLLAHLEARPTIAYRELADPKAGRRGEFSISGYVEIAAQPFLGLVGKAWIRLSSPWWSPAPNRTWPKNLFQREYMLGGPFGWGLDFAYVLGSGVAPEIKPRKPAFDGKALMSDLMDDNVPTGAQSKRKVPGTWKEKTPPAPPPPAPAPVPRGPAKGRPGQKALAPPPQDRARWTGAMTELRKLAGTAQARPYGEAELQRALGAIKNNYGLPRLEAKANGSVWDVHARLGETTNDAKPARIRRASAEPATTPGAAGPQAPPPEKPARDLRDRAGQMVEQRASGEHKAKEIDEIVAAVREDLRPKGLTGLEFEPPNAQGESFLVAKASKGKRVGKKRKPPAVPTRTVVLRATLRFEGVAQEALGELPSKFYPVRIPRPAQGGTAGAVGEQSAAYIGYVPPGQVKHGAALIQPAAGAKQIEIVAWNSGFPVPGTVGSHAESFFLGWLRHARKAGLKELQLQINLSPCSHCAANLRGEVPPGVTATLTYSTPYEGRDGKSRILYANTTTVEDLQSLAPGWTVIGPPPRWTDALKREEIRVGTVFYEGRA